MKFFDRILGRSPKPEVSLHHADIASEGKAAPGVWLYRTPLGDAIGVYKFAMPPDLPTGQSSRSAFIDALRANHKAAGVKTLDVGLTSIHGFNCLRQVIRSGHTYVGSFTVPFKESSLVVKLQCETHGPTGLRDAVLVERALAIGGASDQPLPELDPDDIKFDPEFPGHPIVRLRAWLPVIESAIEFSEERSLQPTFELPTP